MSVINFFSVFCLQIAFQILVKALISLDPGKDMDILKQNFQEFITGLMSLPINLPGTTLYRSLQVKTNGSLWLTDGKTEKSYWISIHWCVFFIPGKEENDKDGGEDHRIKKKGKQQQQPDLQGGGCSGCVTEWAIDGQFDCREHDRHDDTWRRFCSPSHHPCC